MNSNTITLITGGSRSGKTKMALEKAANFTNKIYLATAEAIDSEMRERIKRHREERGPEFLTVEEPVFLAKTVREKAGPGDLILIDCLTFWLNNLFHYGADPAKEIGDFLKVIEERKTSFILVTNELGMGVMPSDPVSRRFVEAHGRLNQEVARRAEEVIFMVSGIPQTLKTSAGIPQ